MSNVNASSGELRVAIIGYGMGGAVFHAPLVAATPGLRVASIVTGNAERSAQARHDFPDATILPTTDAIWSGDERFDLVVVTSSNSSHVPLGLAAIAHGVPVVIDKPMAATVTDAQRLIAASEAAGVLLTCFQNRRYDNDFLTLRRLIAADMLGQVTRFESRFERYRPQINADAWREHPAPEDAGGLLYDLGSHLIDQALVLFGAPESVYAEMSHRRSGAAVDDDTFVALRFADDVVAHLWMSAIAPMLGPRYRVLGLHGAYEKFGLDPQEDALKYGGHPGDAGWGLESDAQWGTLATEVNGIRLESEIASLPGTYEVYYAGVRDAITQGKPLPVDPRDAVRTLRVIEAAQESARSGTTIRL